MSNLMVLEELAEESGRKRLQSHEQQTTLQRHHQQKNLEHGTKYHPSVDRESHQSEK
jgi:hypothetical protein